MLGSFRIFFSIAFLLLMIPISEPLAEIYKWEDEFGNIQYSETPPPKGKENLTITGDLMLIDSEVPDIEFYEPPKELKNKPLPTLKKNDVWMFSTPSCGYCVRAKEYFRIKKISYRELDITKNDEYRTWFKSFGGKGVPFTLVGPDNRLKKIRGFSEEKFNQHFFSK